ncbi:hypothetical protein [Streptomyces sp. C]|uniref:SCO2400 family protein n=1 Tax=Streptomyces sp. C TaxID=253839 RepID=UPI00101B5357|nr:hypothetical protein [Streptomyces sp. C]
MNYFCPACQRHLNGALACAGCGTPAEHLVVAAPSAPARGPEPQPALAEVFADSLVVLSGPHEGRAGTRKRAVNRRRRGRGVLALGLGVVLAAGGSIAVARIVGDDEGVDRADKVVLTDNGPKQPDAPPSVAGPSVPGVLPKASGGAAKTARPSGSPSGSATPSASASASASAATPSQKASADGTSVQPSRSGQPAPGPTGTAKPSPTKTKPGKPQPQPTEECVFWIFC